jgi:hypothetical protein
MNARACSLLACAVLIIGSFVPAIGQSSIQPTPRPTVTAENERWYQNGSPIVWAGNIYYPTGPLIHFNGNEMVRSGAFEGVPLYTRTTQEPYSVVHVPVSGGLMHPYERRRMGDVAGTVGSTAPSFPVVLPAEESNEAAAANLLRPPVPPRPPTPFPEPAPIGTTGTLESEALLPARTRVETLQRPTGLNAVFVTFDNRRWFSDGPAVEFDAARFVQVGEHRGFPVYQERGSTARIYVQLVGGEPGLLSVYRAR